MVLFGRFDLHVQNLAPEPFALFWRYIGHEWPRAACFLEYIGGPLDVEMRWPVVAHLTPPGRA